MQWAPKAEITYNDGHCAIQGHSWSMTTTTRTGICVPSAAAHYEISTWNVCASQGKLHASSTP